MLQQIGTRSTRMLVFGKLDVVSQKHDVETVQTSA